MDLSRLIVIDNHAHSLLKVQKDLDLIGFRQAFSESRSLSFLEKDFAKSIFYQDFLKKIGERFAVAGELGLISWRSSFADSDYIRELFDDVSLGGIIVDDGYRPAEMLNLGQLAQMSGRPIWRACRIETVLEDAIGKCDSFTELETVFSRNLLESGSVKTVAFKTIAAYRGGLEIEPASQASARSDFDRQKALFVKDPGRRISACPLYHYLLRQSFEIAGQMGFAVQVHTGIGDFDEDLRQANPLCLHNVLQSPTFAKTNFVFLHCYPYVREAAYLASIYPNVYFDLSLATTQVAPIAQSLMLDCLAASPTSKILAGTDGHSVAESHWYGVLSCKRALKGALELLVSCDYLNEQNALQIAEEILSGNARRLYNLEGLA